MGHSIPSCTIQYSRNPGNTHICQILAGYKMLEQQGILKIKRAIPCEDFFTSGRYSHSCMVEVNIDGKILTYDMADGYQAIHRKDVFDQQLETVDFYFKRSLNPAFHVGTKSVEKVRALGLNYLCTCKDNPYDDFYSNSGNLLQKARAYATYLHVGNKDKYYYNCFESNNKKYDDYKLIFLTRIWDSSSICAEGLQKSFTYLSDADAKKESENWKHSLDTATSSRIEYVKALREQFGDKVIAGISRDAFSEKTCPELLVDPAITERHHYLQMIKENYICITSEGLHHSIGWKLAEFVAAGKSIITEPLYYTVPYGFSEGTNYLTYNNTESLLNACNTLLQNPEMVHQMEENNRQYYNAHLRPDLLVADSLKEAGIL